jgi:hypothetical protein
MSGIDPDIIVHKINTYPDAKPIRKRLLLVHPRKVVAIKLKVENVLKVGFIYPVALTDWVSNLVVKVLTPDVIKVNINKTFQ